MDDTMPCPICGSRKIYSLMGTFHCKRCKGMWPGDREGPAAAAPCGSPAGSLRPAPAIRPATGLTEQRLERTLDESLRMHHGRIRREDLLHASGDVPEASFRTYLRKCITTGVLVKTRDRDGRILYERKER